jgi:two-component system, sensor histidine kinase and response regulator
VDWAQAMEAVQGNRKLLKSLAEAALDEAPRLIAAIRQTVTDGDQAKLRFSAHALRGDLRYFGASQACDYAARLESMAHEGNLENAETVLGVLEVEIARVTAALRDYVSGS